MNYRLRVNVKRLSGPYHPDRDSQFRYLQSWIDLFREEGWPILSIDTKKKELVGNFANAGETWTEEPYAVQVHDFVSDALYRVAPQQLISQPGPARPADCAARGARTRHIADPPFAWLSSRRRVH